MLSIEGSLGSASTNQTATFGHSMRCRTSCTCTWYFSKGCVNVAWVIHPWGRRAFEDFSKTKISFGEWCGSGNLHIVKTGKRFSKAQESVVQKAKSSPETNQRSQERSSSRLIRRKATSAKVERSDDSDLHTTRKIGDAGLVRPPAESLHEDNGGINLEQAISLLKAERESRTKHLRILLP